MISCAMIFRDDAETIEAALRSVRPYVDQLVCLDTGSVDGSNEIARRYADRVELYLGCNDPETGLIEDFAAARNKSFELADHDTVLWIDADDVLVGGEHLRDVAAQMTGDLEQVFFKYEYAYDETGSYPIVEHYRERLLRPKRAFEWIGVVHECCVPRMPLEGGPPRSALADQIKVSHRRQFTTGDQREPHRNLRILRKRVKDTGGQDLRSLYYLGVELLGAGFAGEGMSILRQYVERVDWRADEQCLACVDIARACRALGDFPAAIEWATKAMMMRNFVAPYWEIGKAMFSLAAADYDPEYNYRRAIFWIRAGLRLAHERAGEIETAQAQNTMERFEIHSYLNVALGRTGDIEGAIRSCEEGLSGLPGHEMLRQNLVAHKNEYAKRTIAREGNWLAEQGEITPGAAKLLEHIARGNLDGAIVSGPQAATMTTQATVAPTPLEARTPEPGKLDLVFFLGPALEVWSPQTLEASGMGGSETMAWGLSRRLARLGHRVRVYGHCTPTMRGVYDGVEWLDYSEYRSVQCDVLIASRTPEAVDGDLGLKAGARVLWLHDTHVGDRLTYARDLRFDRVFALSQWHKRFLCDVYPTLNATKIVVTRNGIDLSRFDGSEPRNPHRAVYSSSPDRGLWTALDVWPRVRAAVPDAELHVYYGFHNWETSARMQGDQAALQSIAHLKHLATHTAGVVFHDRINQRELAREMMRSGVLAYPTWFQETSFCGGMEAQLAGLRIVTSPIAAINETIGDRGAMIGRGDREGMQDPAEWRSPEYMDAFVAAVVEAMTLPESEAWCGLTREELQCHARQAFDIDTLADEWSAMLTELHADVQARVVPPFRAVEVRA